MSSETKSQSDSVRIVLLDENGQFPLVTEGDDLANAKLPGGRFKIGETPSEAAERELPEETGLTPDEVYLEYIGPLPNDDGVSKRYIFIGHISADTEFTPQPPNPDDPEDAGVFDVSRFNLATIPESAHAGHIRQAVNFVLESAQRSQLDV